MSYLGIKCNGGDHIPKCPICEKACNSESKNERIPPRFSCRYVNNEVSFSLSPELWPDKIHDNIKRGKIYSVIFSNILSLRESKIRSATYIYREKGDTIPDLGPLGDFLGKFVITVNIACEMKTFPTTPIGMLDACLLNLSRKCPQLGDDYTTFCGLGECVEFSDRLLFYNSNETQIFNILRTLKHMGYIIGGDDSSPVNYSISIEGWKRIDELKSRLSLDQAFIAMAFQDPYNIYKAIEETVFECHYNPLRMDIKEHNNQIVPELLNEISRSKFLILEISEPNNGAYYEAGYAKGLGKEVIICCKQSQEDGRRPHFDIAQVSMILWENEEDLKSKLMARINGTVGPGKIN